MKLLFTLLFLSTSLWAAPQMILTYFDPFAGAKFNNSEIIAKALAQKFPQIKLCRLSTVFDRAYGELETCVKENPGIDFILGLGESTCNLKVETMMRNWDKTFGPDNAGNERAGEKILPEAPAALGLTYPLTKMYCALSTAERKSIVISNSAGSFVCNNTAYQMRYHYPEKSYGFIHVPVNSCKDLHRKTNQAINLLSQMISSLDEAPANPLPVLKNEIKKLETESQGCEKEFYDRMKGFDDKSWF